MNINEPISTLLVLVLKELQGVDSLNTMLKLRINKLINSLKSIDCKKPGLILNVLKDKELEFPITDAIRQKESQRIYQIINTLFELTNNSKQEIITIICDEFSDSTEKLISTTAYGKIIGINAKPELFEFLRSKGLITRDLNKYQLTKEGMSYGDYVYTEKNEKFIGWRKGKLDHLTKTLRKNLLLNLDFRLYHMTHVSNLEGIFKDGLVSHNLVRNYVDISNNDVNNKRNRNDNPHKINLHQYVPLYFNPRNAMLFSCQKRFGDNVVILEIDNKEIGNDYTLFSEGNAARQNSKVTFNKLEIPNFNWKEINSLTWSENHRDVNVNVKSLMMSECLVLNKINPEKIIKIICNTERVYEILSRQLVNKIELEINKNYFF